MRGGHGDGFFDEHVFACFEGEARVDVVVRVRCGDVYDVDGGVVDEGLVRTVCGGGGGRFAFV